MWPLFSFPVYWQSRSISISHYAFLAKGCHWKASLLWYYPQHCSWESLVISNSKNCKGIENMSFISKLNHILCNLLIATLHLYVFLYPIRPVHLLLKSTVRMSRQLFRQFIWILGSRCWILLYRGLSHQKQRLDLWRVTRMSWFIRTKERAEFHQSLPTR